MHYIAHLYRVQRVPQRLAHLVALLVQHEAVGQHRLVRSVAVGGDRCQQARLEPTSVLVRTYTLFTGFTWDKLHCDERGKVRSHEEGAGVAKQEFETVNETVNEGEN